MTRQLLLALLLCSHGWGFQPSPTHLFSASLPGTSRFRGFPQYQKPIRQEVAESKLWMSSEDEELIEGRKILTMVGYRFSSLIYTFLGLFLVGWRWTKSPSELPQACYVAAGPLLAGGVSYVLEGAAVNDRLSSETFKRLNLFLAQYGVLWLLAAYVLRNTGSKIVSHPLVLAASVVTAFNSLRAWTFGVKGWQQSEATSRMSDLVTTISKYLQVMFSIKTFPGTVYLCGALLFGGLKLFRLVDVYQLLASGVAVPAPISKDIFRISMYSLLSAVLVTLKDGGDRDRLTGSSYVELNAIATCILGAMGAYFYNLGSIALGAASCFLAFFAGTMGYLTYKEKRRALL